MGKETTENTVPWRHSLPLPSRLDEQQTRGLLRKKYRENRKRERQNTEGVRFRSAFEILRGMDLFAPVADGELMKFAALGRERRVERGCPLCLEQVQPDPPLALILEGDALLAWGRGPEELLLRTLEPGDLVGETALFASGAAHRPHNSWMTLHHVERPELHQPIHTLEHTSADSSEHAFMIREPDARYHVSHSDQFHHTTTPRPSPTLEAAPEGWLGESLNRSPLGCTDNNAGVNGVIKNSVILFDADEETAGPSTRALSLVRLMEWDLDAVREALRRWPDVSVGLLGGMARRQHDLQRRVAGLCGGRAPRRLARALAALLRERGVPWRDEMGRRGWRLVRTPSRTRLGAMTGLARETVSRLLATWSRHEWITTRDGDFVVLDRTQWNRLTGNFEREFLEREGFRGAGRIV